MLLLKRSSTPHSPTNLYPALLSRSDADSLLGKITSNMTGTITMRHLVSELGQHEWALPGTSSSPATWIHFAIMSLPADGVPLGKQRSPAQSSREILVGNTNILYTSSSGIWQTVALWLASANKTNLKLRRSLIPWLVHAAFRNLVYVQSMLRWRFCIG